MHQADLTQQPAAIFLERLGSSDPVPAAGSALALAIAMAAALTAKSARLSISRWPGARELLRQAEDLTGAAGGLVQADADAYQRFTTARRRADSAASGTEGDADKGGLDAIVDIPLDIARIASAVAELAATLAQRGNPHLRGDSRAAALLAQAIARAATELVQINLGYRPDERLEQATDFCASADASALRALA